MPQLLTNVLEQQGITPAYWNGVRVQAQPTPKLSVSPDGSSASLRLYVPFGNHQEIQRQLVGYSFNINTPSSPPAPVYQLRRMLPEVFPYYSNFWTNSPPNGLANVPPTLQSNVGAPLGQPMSAKGYPLYATKADVVQHLTPTQAKQLDQGFSYNPPYWVPTPNNPTQNPWKPDLTYALTELLVQFSTLPYRVCFVNEVPSVSYADAAHVAPESLRYTQVNVISQEKMLTGNWAQWVFDPTAGTPPEDSLTTVGSNFAIPTTAGIVTVNWYDVDPAAFNPLALATIGGRTNDAQFYVGVQGINMTYTNPTQGPAGGITYTLAPYWGFPPNTLVLLGYNPVPTISAFGQFFTYTIQMEFLFQPWGVNSGYNPFAIPPATATNNYVGIHLRRAGQNWTNAADPTLVRPFFPANYANLFLGPR